jgi:hypothetical protein
VDWRGALLRHWPLKLSALALSIILWAAVAAEEPVSQLLTVRLDVEVGEGRVLVGPLPTVTALVRGTGRDLLRLFAAPLFIRHVIPETAPASRYRLLLAPADVSLPAGAKVTVEDVRPREVELVLDRVADRVVPVALRGVLEPESGFAWTQFPSLRPAAVRVGGPRSEVQRLDSVPTETLSVRGVTGDFERRLALDTTGLGGLKVSPLEVTVSARAEPARAGRGPSQRR